jgi:hypothetical protein
MYRSVPSSPEAQKTETVVDLRWVEIVELVLPARLFQFLMSAGFRAWRAPLLIVFFRFFPFIPWFWIFPEPRNTQKGHEPDRLQTDSTYTPGMAFFNGLSSTARTTAMNNAISASTRKNVDCSQMSQ